MSADAARRQVDFALPTDSNMVSVVVERFRQDSWYRVGSGVSGQSGDVDSGSDLAGGTATVLLTGSDAGADFAGGGGVAAMNTPPAVFADGVTVAVTSLAIAGVVAADVAVLADADMVTVGVADLADAGMAFPADLDSVVAADVATLADAWLVTIGVADLAVAGMAFPADLAGVVATNVTTLTDAELVTVGVADLARGRWPGSLS